MKGDIAIVGMGCLFPGAQTPERFWENLLAGRDSTSQATAADLGIPPELVYAPHKGQIDRTYCLRGGFVRDFQLDPTGFNAPEDALVERDQSVRWSLYVAREALRDAGYAESNLVRCGIVLGNLSFPTRSSYRTFSPLYRQIIEGGLKAALANEGSGFRLPDWTENGPRRGSPTPAGGYDDLYVAAGPAMTVADVLGLGGPALVLDAACASSLYAVDLAARYLLAGGADIMLAGAVSAADPLMITMGFSIFQAYPEDGESHPLNRVSGGLISGEGAGILALKRYEDALRDGDHVYARVRAIGLSNDGAGRHPLIPRREGQESAYARAYQGSAITQDSIQYVECHATGTPTGDIVELDSMASFFGRPVLCGSVKSNFGHLLTAAGMASIIKVVLSMERGIIPPTIGLSEPLESTDGVAGGSAVVGETAPWPAGTSPRRAAVNAFGFGGTNAHLVLESAGSAPGRRIASAPKPSALSTAITGMDVCLGGAPDLAAYAASIYDGTGFPGGGFPHDRWKGVDRNPEVIGGFGLEEPPPGAYLAGFDLDFIHARVQPDDIPIAQHLALFRVADNALRDAGVSRGGNVAVLIAMDTDLSLHQYRARVDLSWQLRAGLGEAGIYLSDSELELLEEIAKDSISAPGQVNRYMSFIGNIMASRVSALWDFSGPAFTLSAGRESVPHALELADMLLSEGEVDAVVVGAIDLAGGLESVLRRHVKARYTTDSVRLPLDAAGTESAVGEGAGAIVLQREDVQSSNRSYATIDAVRVVSARSEPGGVPARAAGIACRDAMAQARVQPEEIGYAETQASGGEWVARQLTSGLLSAFSSTNAGPSCALGSAALTVGDAQVAGPMSSLIRAALCLHQRTIPGTPEWTGPVQPEMWNDSAFYVPQESRPWFAGDTGRRRAAVIDVGAGASASCVILGDAAHTSARLRGPSTLNPDAVDSFLIPLGGHDRQSILDALDDLARSLRSGTSLEAVARERLQEHDAAQPPEYVLSFVAGSSDEMLVEIERARSGVPAAVERSGEWSTPAGSYFSGAPLGGEGVCFVYPGGFSSYLGQGRDLFHLVPGLMQRLESRVPHLAEMLADTSIYPRSLQPLSPSRERELEHDLLQRSDVATASAGVLAIATTSILRDDFGVTPRHAFGYSLGEATMLWALGVWADLQTAHDRFLSWPGMPLEERAHNWETHLLLASQTAVREALEHEEDVYLTIVSTDGEVFIVGERDACARVIERLGCGHARASFTQVLHCPPVHRAFDHLVDLYRYPVAEEPSVRLYSAADYGPMPLDEVDIARSVARVICQPLDFPRLIRRAYEGGARVFVEMGPGSACSRWIRSVLRERPHLTASIDQKGLSSEAALLRTLARLLSHRVSVDLSLLSDALVSRDRSSAMPAEGARSLVKEVRPGGPDTYRTLAEARGRFHPTRRVVVPEPVRRPMTSSPPTPRVPPLLPVHSMDVGETHRRALQMRLEGLRSITSLVSHSIEALQDEVDTLPHRDADRRAAPTGLQASGPAIAVRPAPVPRPTPPIWDEADLLQFASGTVEPVFGSEYAVIDSYPRRVRLPMPPYLLVNRVTDLRRSGPGLRPATIVTEYDVPLNAWYSSNRHLPVGIAIEAGQCDLLLISYLGIDFQNRGDRVYRLLDCTLTFMDDLPGEGQTLRYEISIDSFARSGESLLFFFHYRCFSGDRLLLKMDNGCAGFFTDDELERGGGVIETESERARRADAVPAVFSAPVDCERRHFDRGALESLSRGDLAACFGPLHQATGSPALRLPPPEFLMLDRVVSIDPQGGAWGTGLIVAEKDLRPDDWYFPCHFRDDQVLAGSLVAEGCVQLLQVYLLFLGMHLGLEDATFEPVVDLPQSVRCRGQITPQHSRLSYRMEIVSIESAPLPSARANVDIEVDGKIVVRFNDLGIRLTGRQVTRPARPSTEAPSAVLFDERQVKEFATGSIVACFGPEYAVYTERRTPRIPNGDLQFISRVVDIAGTRGRLSDSSTLISEYDVPDDVWFYRETSASVLPQSEANALDAPYSALMEMGLQPCGFLSGWLGSTLGDPETDFYFRNLDGHGRLLRHADVRGKTVQAQVRLRSSTRTPGVIIQAFEYELSCDRAPFFAGDAVFGYFTRSGLAQQTGLDGGQHAPSWHALHPSAFGRDIDLQAVRTLFSGTGPAPHLHLTGGHFDLLDRAFVSPDGGVHGKGYVECFRAVRPDDWFFDCHFYQDPVMPGSLGVEALVEALQIFALEGRFGERFSNPRFSQVAGNETVWKYRGQIVRENLEMQVEVHVRDIEAREDSTVLRADGSLWRDGLRIYEVSNLGLAVCAS